jgi:CRISPR associated protein.
MLLTVADVDIRNPLVRDELADVHRLHARILNLTDPQPVDGPRMLWAQLSHDRLAIRTNHPIPEDRWPDGYLKAVTTREWTPPPAGPVSAVCVVNPVRRSSRTGRIIATPIPDEEIQPWLAERLTTAGIRPDEINVVRVRTVSGRRAGARVIHRVAVCRLTGTVTDREAATRLAVAGVGRAKSYGCGLTAWWSR